MENCTALKNMNPVDIEEYKKIKFDHTTYRIAIGNLIYLAINTRPDILFAVNKASRRSKEPNLNDWMNVQKIFRYLKRNFRLWNQLLKK